MGLYTSNILIEIGISHSLTIYTDSSACIGHCARRGNGKRMRHLEAADLWIQHIFKQGRARLQKINGKLNPADLYTKYLSRAEIVYHMSFLGHRLFDDMGQEIGNKDAEQEWGNDIASNLDIRKEDEAEEVTLADFFASAVDGPMAEGMEDFTAAAGKHG